MNISWDAVDWRLSVMSIYLMLPILAVTVVYFDEKSKGKKNVADFKFLLSTIALCLSAGLLMLTMIIYPAIGAWKEMASGTYDRVEYTDTRVKRAPVGYRYIHKTIIHFKDGRTVTLRGEYSIEFPKGTNLKVMTKNDFYKILKAE